MQREKRHFNNENLEPQNHVLARVTLDLCRRLAYDTLTNGYVLVPWGNVFIGLGVRDKTAVWGILLLCPALRSFIVIQ